VIKKFDSLMNDCVEGGAGPCGRGAHYDAPDTDTTDVKNFASTGPLGAMTTGTSPTALATDTHVTHDQGSTNRPFTGPVATDSNGNWTIAGRTSPAQGALVDAHYYAGVAHRFFGEKFINYNDYYSPDFVWPTGSLPMNIQAHFFKDYVNAFWNGDLLAFGDGDGVSYGELTSLDVVGHEMTHAVTEFTSNLIYSGESGALNEAFSDMMGNTMEWYAKANSLEPSPSLKADWLVGEDFDRRSSESEKGFRNMAYPEEDGDPSHYSNRYTGTSDNGGVHTNSGIPNHAYYLLVEGDKNDCERKPAHSHCDNPGLTGLGPDVASTIFFLGFTALNESANMCDARESTALVAGSNVGAVEAAWEAVGVTAELCGGGNITSNNPPSAVFSASSTNVEVGENVTFTSTSTDTEDGDASKLNHSWDFKDTNSESGFGLAVVNHSFDAPGTYSVTLTVTDSGGKTDTVSIDIQVTDPSCTPSGLSCATSSDCCSLTCKGKPGSRICK